MVCGNLLYICVYTKAPEWLVNSHYPGEIKQKIAIICHEIKSFLIAKFTSANLIPIPHSVLLEFDFPKKINLVNKIFIANKTSSNTPGTFLGNGLHLQIM